MLVSIVVNNYNYEKYLSAAIESALNQTYPDVEVIVVDDGSTDGSRSVIENFGDRIISIFKSNGGQASALNSGFGRARGELVLFLDSDDTLKAEATSEVVLNWREEYAKLHFPLETIDEKGASLNELFPRESLSSGNVLPSLLRKGEYRTSPTTGNVFSRRFLNTVMPIPETEWPDCADTYIVALAPFFGEVGLIPEPLGQYRIHGSNLTAHTKNGRLRIDKLRQALSVAVRKQRLLDNFCHEHGFSMKPFAVFDSYNHYKVRLASLKISPIGHPFQQDRLLPVASCLVKRVWHTKELHLLTRVAFTIWAYLVAVLPLQFSDYILVQAFSPYDRFRLFAKVVKLSKAFRAPSPAVRPNSSH